MKRLRSSTTSSSSYICLEGGGDTKRMGGKGGGEMESTLIACQTFCRHVNAGKKQIQHVGTLHIPQQRLLCISSFISATYLEPWSNVANKN